MIPNPPNWFGEYPLTLSLSPPARLGEQATQPGRIRKRMRLGERTPELSAADIPGFPRPNGERDRVRGDFLKQRKQIERVRYEG